MKIEKLQLGQTVWIKEYGEYTEAKVDSFTTDMFTGEKLVIVEVNGRPIVANPKSLRKHKR